MKCTYCDSNKPLDIGYHIWDSQDDNSDIWDNNDYDKAIKKYNKLVEKEPNKEWRLARETYCEDCTSGDEEFLEANDVEYKNL